VNGWHRILVGVLVVAQLLAAAPFASAQPVTMAMSNMPADMDDCPCCPAGADSLRDCLAACTLAVAALPEIPIPIRAATPALRIDAALSVAPHSLSEPPLKPPPIR
jgi:hypothetical protein